MKNTFVLVALLTLLLGGGQTVYGGPTNPGVHEVPLLTQVDVPIIADGKQIGSMKLAPGSLVSVVSVQSDGIMVTRGEGAPFKVSKDVIAPDALAATLATPPPRQVAVSQQVTPTPTTTPAPSNQAANPSTASPAPQNKMAADPKLAEWDAGPLAGAALDTVQFRWWSPPGIKSIRGVMVLVNGRNMDGRGFVDDRGWQQFATEMQLGLIGCNFVGIKDHATYQNDPTGDLGRKINEAVDKLAAQNGFPDLKSPPLVFWGHSAGAMVNETYAKHFPDRVLAAINLKGPAGPGDTTPAKNKVPFLIITGLKDKPDWVSGSKANFEIGHKAHAVWTQALSPNEGHESGKSHPLMLAFLRAVLLQRLGPPPTAPLAFPKPVEVKSISSSDGWLGNPATYDIASQSSYQGDRNAAIWIPDEATAKAWQSFLRGN